MIGSTRDGRLLNGRFRLKYYNDVAGIEQGRVSRYWSLCGRSKGRSARHEAGGSTTRIVFFLSFLVVVSVRMNGSDSVYQV